MAELPLFLALAFRMPVLLSAVVLVCKAGSTLQKLASSNRQYGRLETTQKSSTGGPFVAAWAVLMSEVFFTTLKVVYTTV